MWERGCVSFQLFLSIYKFRTERFKPFLPIGPRVCRLLRSSLVYHRVYRVVPVFVCCDQGPVNNLWFRFVWESPEGRGRALGEIWSYLPEGIFPAGKTLDFSCTLGVIWWEFELRDGLSNAFKLRFVLVLRDWNEQWIFHLIWQGIIFNLLNW